VNSKLRIGLLARLFIVIVGLGIVGYAAKRSVFVTAAVIATMVGLFLTTKRRSRRTRHKNAAADIVLVALLTLLMWTGIALAFKLVDSSDPELLAVSFSGDLTIEGIGIVGLMTVAGASAAWYALSIERSSRQRRRNRRSPRRGADVASTANGNAAENSEA
jgi:protein-S-isoprenylcysteine O-methyltransferase Ste14